MMNEPTEPTLEELFAEEDRLLNEARSTVGESVLVVLNRLDDIRSLIEEKVREQFRNSAYPFVRDPHRVTTREQEKREQ